MTIALGLTVAAERDQQRRLHSTSTCVPNPDSGVGVPREPARELGPARSARHGGSPRAGLRQTGCRTPATHRQCSLCAAPVPVPSDRSADVHSRLTPDAAVRAVPPRLLMSLLLRSSWLTVEGGRQIGAAGLLHRRGGGAAVAVSVGVAGGVPLQPRAVRCAAIRYFWDASLRSAYCL